MSKHKYTKTYIKQHGFPKRFRELSCITEIPKSLDAKGKFNCPLHGEFEMSYNGLLDNIAAGGLGCPLCDKSRRSKINKENARKANGGRIGRRKKNPFSEQFLKDLEGSPDKDRVLSGELKVADKAQFYCKEHGLYLQQISSHLAGKGCPKCAIKRQSRAFYKQAREKNPYPIEFLKKLESSPDKEAVLKGKIRIKDKIMLRCPKHGLYLQELQHAIEGHCCPTCAAHQANWSSGFEKKIESDLKDLGIKVIRSYRGGIIRGSNGRNLELDLYLPDENLAIEVDGLYWHAYETMLESRGYNLAEDKRNYHKIKTDLCEKKGIQLLHLFEDDLKRDYRLCFNLILSKIGKLHKKTIYARSCKIIEVTSEVARNFYNKYHIQGWGQGNVLGLEYKGHLVSCMSSRRGASNTSSKDAYELNRYASINNYFVVGGFEKLMKAHEKKYQIKKWISYADRTVSNGALYFRTGWTLESTSEPDYKYIYKGVRYHKFNFRIKRFKDDPNLKYEEGLTEFQLARLNKITRIYDCGKMKFTKIV